MKDEIRMTSQKRTKEKFKSPFSSKCSYGYSTHIEGFHDSTGKHLFTCSQNNKKNRYISLYIC